MLWSGNASALSRRELYAHGRGLATIYVIRPRRQTEKPAGRRVFSFSFKGFTDRDGARRAQFWTALIGKELKKQVKFPWLIAGEDEA
jgi:hypothetical protein